MLICLTALLLTAPPVKSVEDLPKLLGEEFDLLESLDELDEDRRKQEKDLSENRKQRLDVIERRDRADKRHRKAKAQLEKARDLIRRRIRVYLDLKKVKDWQLLASAGDYATYLRKRRVLKQLTRDDEVRITQYHDVVKSYRDAKKKHEDELAELKRVEDRIDTARSQLKRDKAIKKALLESVRTEKSFFSKAGKDLDKASQRLEERITNFAEWSGKRLWFRDLKGQYLFPLPGGKIRQGFGRQTHPRFGTVTMHRGIRFVPGRKDLRTVRVIYWGRVVFAGRLRGFGQTIIVDHTKRDYTLYGNLAEIDVEKGDVLKSRQAIGKMGKSGPLEEEHLYFELRIDGKPENPDKWFRR